MPEGACIIVGNHAQMNGPICAEFYISGKHTTWCAGEMMELKEVPSYAFRDFWSRKPKFARPFYKVLSYLIAPLSVCIFNNAHTIPVYHDNRLMSTFKKTVSALEKESRVVIFPECYTPYNQIVNDFQEKFVDAAKLYYKRTGKQLSFVPMYIAPARKMVYFGKPVVFDAASPIAEERNRICSYLKDHITELALALPRHRVVCYANVPKKMRPYSKEESL